MAKKLDLSSIDKFEEELGSSLRHCRYTSRKLNQLINNAVELKLNNQNFVYKQNNIDPDIKSILDNVQYINEKLNVVETTVDCTDKTAMNFEESVQELEHIVNIVSNNKNTIFTHRKLL